MLYYIEIDAQHRHFKKYLTAFFGSVKIDGHVDILFFKYLIVFLDLSKNGSAYI